MPQDYNKTICLPKTDFPMRAGLPAREPVMLESWRGRYEKLMEKNVGKPLFVLHDGPPFSNGDIHMGTAMNKVLKDFVLRYKNMAGFRAPYVPGWDNHGLPIESAILKQTKADRGSRPIPEFRDACRDFAMDYVDRQRAQFVRLGILGDWEHPYLTMDPAFEACEVNVFGRMAEEGYIYRGLKPVYWCPHDETALAEAEIEYQEEDCHSIYVKFPIQNDKGLLRGLCDLSRAYVVIWTTTTWTLPGNVAVSLHPRFSYGLYRAGGDCFLIAEELVDAVSKAAGWDSYEELSSFTGKELEGISARHPFLDRESLVIVGEHVTADSGTGCVHTAPGHGLEDYFACKNYDLPVVVPVDAHGVMTAEAGPFAGLYYAKANAAILERLTQDGLLLASLKISHTYPHCWRCKQPVIYRATKQWFASVDAMKDKALAAVDTVEWIPGWGHDRMAAMVRERADWCISRQRHWGLPIPAFYCAECKTERITKESIAAVSALFAREGSNAWYTRDAADILPVGTTCPHCGCKVFTKETDTLDGWFDSGSTHEAVLTTRPDLHWPADLYLEGGDQFRGWFQSSLLTAVATRGAAPSRAVSTHGWTVDGEGKKMSKSLGNVINPTTIMAQYGADILRLWVASSDYHNDVRISEEIFRQLSDIYLKIRNTARFILGNLDGFDPDQLVPYDDLPELDRWALSRLNLLIARVRASYDAYEYHTIFHAVHNFCVSDLSNFYFDALKDRLYCDGPNSLSRKAAQTAMHLILDGMTRLIAPVLAFTSEEIWAAMSHECSADPESVLFNEMPSPQAAWALSPEISQKWEQLVALRDTVNAALEKARADKLIGKPLEACITLTADGERLAFLRACEALLPSIFIVSEVILREGSEAIEVARAEGEKCPRCWAYVRKTGSPQEHPDLCNRCAVVVSGL